MKLTVSSGIYSFNNLCIILLIIALTPNCESVAAPDPSKESLDILRNLQSTMRSMEARLNNLDSKLAQVNLVDHAFRMNNVQSKVEETSSSIVLIGGKVERIESILNKLQLTDQEKKKWCNTDYGQSLFSLHKGESESVRRQMSSMLTEISELIRSGMGKLLIRMDSLLTETTKSSSTSSSASSSGGNYKPSDSSTSFKLPSSTLPSTTTNSRSGYELAGNSGVNSGSNSGDGNIGASGDYQQVTLIQQLNKKLDTLVGRCLSSDRGSDNSGEMVTTLAQIRSLSQDTLNTMVKKVELAENQLLTSVLNSLQIPGKLSQIKDAFEENVNKLRSQVDGLSANAPILRILRHIKTQLPDVSRVTCMDEQTSELLEKATIQVNTMINDYTKQINSIDHSLTNINTIVNRLNSLVDKYKNNYVQQNTSSGSLRTSISSWE